MKKIAVYGSLRKGMYNHSLIDHDGAKFATQMDLTLPYKMVPYSSFPALIPDKNQNVITMEIYEVDEPTYKRVEILEGYPRFYDKDTFDLEGENVEFYYIPDKNNYLTQRFSETKSIKDWVDYFKKNFKIYE